MIVLPSALPPHLLLVPLCGWGRYYDHKVGQFRRKAVPLCYILSKGEYKVNAAVTRDSMKRCAAQFDSGYRGILIVFCGRWVKEIWGCNNKISAAVADGSLQFHDGMIYLVKASTDPELKFEMSREPFLNDDGSENWLGNGLVPPETKGPEHYMDYVLRDNTMSPTWRLTIYSAPM